ncbi:MAG: pseudouridine synthase family protein [Succinivibrionaceae bacterium]
MVVNKKNGILTVPGKIYKDSVTTRLKSIYSYINPIHRLDSSTSGILLFAKNPSVLNEISQQFSNKTIVKYYVANVDGIIQKNFGFLNYPMIRDFTKIQITSAPIQKVCYEFGKKSLTYFYVINRDFSKNTTTVLLRPYTGRTHQLRLHLSCFGHPIVNDKLYSHYNGDNYLELHSCLLQFYYPSLQKCIRIFAPSFFLCNLTYSFFNKLNFPKRWS